MHDIPLFLMVAVPTFSCVGALSYPCELGIKDVLHEAANYALAPRITSRLFDLSSILAIARNMRRYLYDVRFSLIRLISSFTAADPFENDGMEWIRLTVGGQSFIMHQIRKMVSSFH